MTIGSYVKLCVILHVQQEDYTNFYNQDILTHMYAFRNMNTPLFHDGTGLPLFLICIFQILKFVMYIHNFFIHHSYSTFYFSPYIWMSKHPFNCKYPCNCVHDHKDEVFFLLISSFSFTHLLPKIQQPQHFCHDHALLICKYYHKVNIFFHICLYFSKDVLHATHTDSSCMVFNKNCIICYINGFDYNYGQYFNYAHILNHIFPYNFN